MKISKEAREAALYCVCLTEERRTIVAERIQEAINSTLDRASEVALEHMPVVQCMSVEPIVSACKEISAAILALKEDTQ